MMEQCNEDDRIANDYSMLMETVREKINLPSELFEETTQNTYEKKFTDHLNFKDQLLANLYATNEFLKKELEEKNYIIRALLHREAEYNKDSFLMDSRIHETSNEVERTDNPESNESFNSELVTFNDSLDDNNLNNPSVCSTTDDHRDEQIGNDTSFDGDDVHNKTNVSLEENHTREYMHASTYTRVHTREYIPVQRQLSEYKNSHRKNFSVIKKSEKVHRATL